jgi:thymidylate kinase
LKIAFSGPQASGKSTIIKNLLDNHLNKQDYTFIKGGARKLKDLGFEINEKGDDLSQVLLFNNYIDDLVIKPKQYNTKNFIYDRWLMDGVVYSEWSTSIGKNKPWVFDYGLLMLRMLCTEIDIVFYCDPNGIPVENDNYRNVDLEYRNIITSIFENYMKEHVAPFKKLVRLTGSLQDRTAKVLKEINIQDSPNAAN